MSTLSDFVHELATELDRRRAGGPPLPALPPHRWMDLCKLFALLDRDETPAGIELRRKIEKIATRRDVPFQKRCAALLPLLLPLLPPGSVQ
jgi:hypothetical protein